MNHFLIRTIRAAAVVCGYLGISAAAQAQTVQLPLENREQTATYNLQSYHGVPISSTTNNPAGSDGRAPTQAAQSAAGLTVNIPTARQFQSVFGVGSVAAPQSPANLNLAQPFGTRALNMKLPVGQSNGVVVFVLKSAWVGASIVNPQSAILFGSVISVPDTDEFGQKLSNTVRKEDYWLAEPYLPANAVPSYYWSPNARVVFANQPGQVNITWRKATPSLSQPADYSTNQTAYYVQGGNYYRLYQVRYVVSGAAIKPPRTIYWTEGSEFAGTASPVDVPPARLSGVRVIYQSAFPANAAKPYVSPNPQIATNMLQETRTLWYENGQIHAYNIEGRVLVELLGDARPGTTNFQHLGFEIVDVVQRPIPADVTTELGERLNAWQDGRDDSDLLPKPVIIPKSLFPHTPSLAARTTLYARGVTTSQNEVQVHWLQQGLQGIYWPYRFVRYQFVWPSDPAKYSHYVRPPAQSDEEASRTAVSLPRDNVPVLDFQDGVAGSERGKLTTQFKYYSWLDSSFPAHRALLRFTSGEHVYFERVFSWLDTSLISGDFGSSVAINLSSWNPNSSQLEWQDALKAPRVISDTVSVGQRIDSPTDETTTNGYWAGYIQQGVGNSFSTNSYIDPFVAGFDAANLGAIIPVNVIPGNNRLEVWWFRPNAADLIQGFKTIYWPSVIGRYTVQWPAAPREIVLASNDGSGPLESLEAQGTIYTQNDRTAAGYNPNEEHALMIAGQAYALRDDLNITSGADYSSEPYVLVEYMDADDRPSISVFKVLREKPSEGIVFDYVVEAGSILQAPMPLPLMEKPVEGTGATAVNFNAEPLSTGADLPGNWSDATFGSGPFAHYRGFTYRDRKENYWVYRGFNGPPPLLQAGSGVGFVSSMTGTAVAGNDFSFTVHVSRRAEALTLTTATNTTLPNWLTISGLSLIGRPALTDVRTNQLHLNLIVADADDGSQVTVTLNLSVLGSGTVVGQAPLQIIALNDYAGGAVTYFGRPPYLAASPVPTNTFTMRFYYKTLPGFAWPGVTTPPDAGSIVPYLRKKDVTGFVGDPASKSTAGLDIVYRPVWPALIPSMRYGDTLTTPKLGLPAVRGQTSLQVLYQQSIARDIVQAKPSVVLHDSTREKVFTLSATGLKSLPGGVRAELFQGKKFFPNLPPHLGQRFFFDASRGTFGQLVLRGQFADEKLGEKYLLLNVLRGADLAAVKGLCPNGDASKAAWDQAIDSLATTLETFHEDPAVPGSYIKDAGKDQTIGVGAVAEIKDDDIAVDSYALSASGPGSGYVTLITGNGRAFSPVAEPVTLQIIKVTAPLYTGELKVIPSSNPLNEQLTLQHTADLGGRSSDYEYEWRISPPVDGLPPDVNAAMTGWTLLASGAEIPRFTLGGAGIQALTDNYLVMRYRPTDPAHPLHNQWSAWTKPQLAEGWIKRVLAGINPFSQRVTDLFNNRVNTDVSLISQAGHRWEGNVALNLENINSFGLIEIYETVLRRGKMLSIDAGINYGPANDALLLAAGYLNDLYMMLGNEAWADAANPTIAVGKGALTDVATALFAFKGQVASLLDEELALLRGRDDFLQPGVETAPVYNRLVWNYTRGIDSGEVVYALNYNIKENPDGPVDGVVDATDAARLYPQGHGDAYGHYLTALKGYYALLMDTDFDWVPRTEAVSVLGQAIQVDYQDERKFAAAAAATARAARQVLDLTWREDYKPGRDQGWQHLEQTRDNSHRAVPTTRYWGVDHWAARAGQGTFLDWVVGNAILPDVDSNPSHEGIQKIDRTTVPELLEMTSIGTQLQRDLDNAEAGLCPLGLPDGALAFDITPGLVTGPSSSTHFEQIFERAKTALNNAVVAFEDAKSVTALMRSEDDSLADFQAKVADQELAYQTKLIELYGSAYPDDVGPGKTYDTGYAGPDLLHYMYVDLAELTYPNLLDPAKPQTYKIDVQAFPSNYQDVLANSIDWIIPGNSASYTNDTSKSGGTIRYVEYQLGPHGFFDKPPAWKSKRQSPGKIQQAISGLIKARTQLQSVLTDATNDKNALDKTIQLWNFKIGVDKTNRAVDQTFLGLNTVNKEIHFAMDMFEKMDDLVTKVESRQLKVLEKALPRVLIVGAADGGDETSIARAALEEAAGISESKFDSEAFIKFFISESLDNGLDVAEKFSDFYDVAPRNIDLGIRTDVVKMAGDLAKVQKDVYAINQKLQDLDDAQRAYQSLLAEGDRTQAERATFRKRSSPIIQGYRTRDAAFRIFRNEKLERYKTLFDLAAQYTYLSANAYDYETGLLHTDQGRAFINRIVRSRALGVVRNNLPQYAGSDTGDPGLSSALAEMQTDWSTLRNRLGFNNPDGYGTTVSLRTENLRILPSKDGNQNWQDALQQGRRANLLDDQDVQRYCMQIQRSDGQPVPGIILEFSTTISDGLNFFGQRLAAGDHAYTPSSFATKIFGVGVALEGYHGIDDPTATTIAVGSAGGQSPTDPTFPFLDPMALSATPYVYLIPVGVDSMRSPPLGDSSEIRTWAVDDVTIPMPFNISASSFDSQPLWQSSQSLSEPLFNLRKHQAFRAVSNTKNFTTGVLGGGGSLSTSSYTNRRLIGRSVWNSHWKLIIPGQTLLNDPNEGLDRFMQTVTDIKLYYVTYSYSGN